MLDFILEGSVVILLIVVCAKAHHYGDVLRNEFSSGKRVCVTGSYPDCAIGYMTVLALTYLGAAMCIIAILFHVISHNMYGNPMENDFEYILYIGMVFLCLGTVGLLDTPKKNDVS